jgi:hypothetical protein
VGPEGRVDAYVCGNSTYETHSRWFCGDLAGAIPTGFVEIVQDDWTFRARIERDRIAGILLSPEGVAVSFGASPQGAGSRTNIYEDDSAGCRTGVIAIEEPNRDPYFAGTWCDARGQFGQVTPLSPADLTADSLEVVAETPTGFTELVVTPLVP